MSIGQLISDLYGESQRKSLLIAVDKITNEFKAFLYVDAVLSESVNMTKSTPEFPVEKGISMSDTSVIEPITATIHCIASEDPLEKSGIMKDSSNKLRAIVGRDALKDELTQQGLGLQVSLISTNAYILAAHDFIERAMEETSSLIIKIGLGYYFDMAVSSVSFEKNPSNSGVLEFDLSLKEINLVKSRFTDMDETIEFNPDIPDLGKYGDGTSTNADVSKEKEEKLTPEEQAEMVRTKLVKLLEVVTKNLANVIEGF